MCFNLHIKVIQVKDFEEQVFLLFFISSVAESFLAIPFFIILSYYQILIFPVSTAVWGFSFFANVIAIICVLCILFLINNDEGRLKESWTVLCLYMEGSISFQIMSGVIRKNCKDWKTTTLALLILAIKITGKFDNFSRISTFVWN